MPQIRIEDKHKYSHYIANIFGNIRTTNVVANSGTFRWFTPVLPVQGTGNDERIGRKIYTENILVEGFLNFQLSPDSVNNVNSVMDYFNGYMQYYIQQLVPDNYEWNMLFNKITIPIRHMVVEFYDEDFYNGTVGDQGVYLASWFKSLHIQTTNSSTDLVSVQQDIKRESTSYTGRFKILKDTTYWLDPVEKHSIHFNYSLPYKKNINFEADGSDATNSHLYFIWVEVTIQNPNRISRNKVKFQTTMVNI